MNKVPVHVGQPGESAAAANGSMPDDNLVTPGQCPRMSDQLFGTHQPPPEWRFAGRRMEVTGNPPWNNGEESLNHRRDSNGPANGDLASPLRSRRDPDRPRLGRNLALPM